MKFAACLQNVSNPKNFLYDCLRRSALNNCDSLAGDFAMKGIAIVPYIQGIAEPIIRIINDSGIKAALKPIETFWAHFRQTQGSRSNQSENTCCVFYTMR